MLTFYDSMMNDRTTAIFFVLLHDECLHGQLKIKLYVYGRDINNIVI